MEYSYTKEEIREMQKQLNEWVDKDDKHKQIECFWKGPMGKSYLHRNPIDPKTRVKGFKALVGGLPIKTILEVGCNKGHNLTALSMIKGKNYELHGIDPYGHVLEEGRKNGCPATLVEADAFNIPYPDNYFDLVFTYGVLIHISNKYLWEAIHEIYRVSRKYILTIEYGVSKSTQEVIITESGIEFICHRSYTNIFPNLRACGVITKREFDDFGKTLFWWLFDLGK